MVKVCCIWANWLYSGKVVVFMQNGYIRASWIYLGRIWCNGDNSLYFGRIGCVWANWLYSGKGVVFG